MSGINAGYRQRLFRGVHAEALKRGLDHDALHDLAREKYRVPSMGDLTDAQLLAMYRSWTGKKTLRRRAELANPGWQEQTEAMVSGEEVNSIAQEFAKRGLGREGQAAFIRRLGMAMTWHLLSGLSATVASLACAVLFGRAGHAAKRGDRPALVKWLAIGAVLLAANAAIQIAGWRR